MEAEKKRIRGSGDAGRCSKQRSQKNYGKKRKTPNKKGQTREKKIIIENVVNDNSTNDNSSVELTKPVLTASTEKFDDICNVADVKEEVITGFRLIEMSILSKVVSILACPDCKNVNTFHLVEVSDKKLGLSSLLKLKCDTCDFSHQFYTSPEVSSSLDKKHRGKKSMEVNIRAVYGFRCIGVGYSLISKLCGFLNMPQPMAKESYDHLANRIKLASKTIAEKSMSDAAAELRKGNKTADVGVSVDGTWQRKGFSSTLGVITAISIDSGKVLDTAILSKSCKGCTRMEKIAKINPNRYQLWKASHKCNLNYEGSSPAMECAGATTIFGRSVEKYGLYYTSFYGDGDSKAYPAVKDIYENKTIVKRECIGHYQKRVGCRLRKLKKNTKGLGGRGKLTDAKIDTLQNYFGIALRNNKGNLNQMIKACKASMYHVAGYHENCPYSKDSWCQYQLDKINSTSLYKKKNGLSLEIRKAILPIYLDLCKPEMLEKCLHGKTQNTNESFNGTIWNRVPKSNHVGLNTLCFGVYDAISHFNNGSQAALDTMNLLGINPGLYMLKACGVVNRTRKRHSVYRAMSPQKKRRTLLRHSKKRKSDKVTEKEGTLYEPGGF